MPHTANSKVEFGTDRSVIRIKTELTILYIGGRTLVSDFDRAIREFFCFYNLFIVYFNAIFVRLITTK